MVLLAFVGLLGHGSLPGLRLVGRKKKGRNALHAHMRSGSWDALKTERHLCARRNLHTVDTPRKPADSVTANVWLLPTGWCFEALSQ